MTFQVYIARRVLLLLPTLLGITLITFVTSHAMPIDPVVAFIGDKAAGNPEIVQAFREKWGLDKSLPQQYLAYLGNLLRGDLGVSLRSQRPVLESIKDHFPATIELATASALISIGLGTSLGIAAAIRRDSFLDQILRVFSLLGTSAPVFWLALMAITILYGKLGWAPPPGRLDVLLTAPAGPSGSYILDSLLHRDFAVFIDAVKHLLLPSIVLASYALGLITRVTRSAVLDAIDADYVRTARAKGLTERAVVYIHVLRNALIPVITVVGLVYGDLMGGAVLTETIFSWPGMGRYAYQAVSDLDFPAIMGITLVISVIYVIMNLTVDILYGCIDPRIRVT